MGTLTLTIAFLMGLTGSLHCAGMCGPIMWIMPFQAYKGIKKVVAIGLYHLGRISVYAALAIVLHSFRNLFEPKAQQYISITLGGSLLAVGILSFLPNNSFKFRLPWFGQVQKQLSSVISKPGLATIGIAGILNGLLPCGLVYMALSASMAASTTLQTAAFMYAFGMGTLPMLIGIVLLKTRLSPLRASNFKPFVPVVVFMFGCLFVVRGMNLGIPYLSPKVLVEQHGIKSCCCHKK